MPLWAVVYLLIIGVVSAWAVTDDLRKGQSRVRSTADVLAILALAYLFVVRFVPAFGTPLGRWAAPLFAIALLWTGIAAHREIQEEDPDPDLSPRANLVAEHLGILVGVLAFAPLIAFAGLAAFTLWRSDT